MKVVLKCRKNIQQSQVWPSLMIQNKFKIRAMYKELKENNQDVNWKKMMFGNIARTRAIHNMWMACHNSLETKDRLVQFRLLADTVCYFGRSISSLQHFLFDCQTTKRIWEHVFQWLQIKHQPLGWKEKLQ